MALIDYSIVFGIFVMVGIYMFACKKMLNSEAATGIPSVKTSRK